LGGKEILVPEINAGRRIIINEIMTRTMPWSISLSVQRENIMPKVYHLPLNRDFSTNMEEIRRARKTDGSGSIRPKPIKADDSNMLSAAKRIILSHQAEKIF
jgi:hypothetical protein